LIVNLFKKHTYPAGLANSSPGNRRLATCIFADYRPKARYWIFEFVETVGGLFHGFGE